MTKKVTLQDMSFQKKKYIYLQPCMMTKDWKQVIFVYVPQAWDLGYGFDIGILYKSGWFVFFGSILTAASLAYFL